YAASAFPQNGEYSRSTKQGSPYFLTDCERQELTCTRNHWSLFLIPAEPSLSAAEAWTRCSTARSREAPFCSYTLTAASPQSRFRPFLTWCGRTSSTRRVPASSSQPLRIAPTPSQNLSANTSDGKP